MSFGSSVGDFIAAIELANRIRKEFVNAPGQFKAISDDVRSLSIILQDIDINLSDHELNDQQRTRLQEISSSCRNVLNELEKTTWKYQELEHRGGSLSMKAKRVWKRVKWEPEDIRELRDRITSNVLLLSTFIGGISSQMISEAKRGVNELNRKQNDQERHIILDWLTTIDYAPQQSDFINRRQEGTGQWLIDSEEYQTWVQTPKKTLFCPGFPGAGKTILTAITVDDLTMRFRNEANIGIAYLYCNFRRQDEQKADDLLTSLLKQLSQDRVSLPDPVKTLYEKHKDKRTRPSFDEVSKTFQSITTMFSKVFIIIDALDECRTTDGCRTRLLTEIFLAQAKSRVNVFATSRFLPEVTEKFEGSISLEIRASEDDVRRYLDNCMFRLPAFVSRSPDLQEEIKTRIVLLVKGMFLLAQLYLESLIGKRSPKAIRTTLKNLATGSGAYDPAYEDAMERINGQVKDQEELAKQILSWITCAKRPLTITELRHALAVEIGESQLDEDNFPQVEDIVSICAGLVTVDKESNIIRLIHYTTQEYFNRTREKWFPNAETNIAIICVTYLSFDKFKSRLCQNDDEFEQRLESNRLYDYASHNWGHYAREASISIPEVISFLEKKAQVEASSQALMAIKRYPNNVEYSQRIPMHMTGLHLAAHFGIHNAVQDLLGNNSPNPKDSYDQTPLSWAAKNGHEATIQLLLENGADVESKDKDGQTPLLWAAKNGHEAVVKLLLGNGANVESKDKDDQTPLFWAAVNMHGAVVKLLLENGADIEWKDKNGQTLLYLPFRGHVAIIQQLLQNGANIESKDKGGWTPLLHAAFGRNDGLVKVLLENGAEIKSENKDGWTPIFVAAKSGSEAVVKLLLENGAEIEWNDYPTGPPLFWAAHQGNDAVVKLLLENGADANTALKDKPGTTPLLAAVLLGHEAVVKLLLENGADATSKDRPLLLWASRNGHEAIVKLLLENGADANTAPKDEPGTTPLLAAVACGHEAVVKLLLENGADAELKDSDGQMPLLYGAPRNGHEALEMRSRKSRVERYIRSRKGVSGGSRTDMIHSYLQY